MILVRIDWRQENGLPKEDCQAKVNVQLDIVCDILTASSATLVILGRQVQISELAKVMALTDHDLEVRVGLAGSGVGHGVERQEREVMGRFIRDWIFQSDLLEPSGGNVEGFRVDVESHLGHIMDLGQYQGVKVIELEGIGRVGC